MDTNDNKEASLDEFGEILRSIMARNPEDKRTLDEMLKEEQEYWALITPHFGKTREQLEQDIPDGAYKIGTGPLIAYTGKGGLINMILIQQEEINKYKLL